MKDIEQLRIENEKLKVYEVQFKIEMPEYNTSDIPTKKEMELTKQVDQLKIKVESLE